MAKSKVTAKKAISIRDRIKRFDRVPASQIAPSPHNWRMHPKQQQEALRAVLEDVGFAGAVLCRELPDGSLACVDGHLRLETMGAAEVPVLVTDLTEGEAKTILATFDPIGAMAETDKDKLDALLREVQTESEAVANMLQELAAEAGCEWAKATPGGGGDEFDATPEETGPTRTNVGELWEIEGGHRLLVGDCTDAANVARLMGGEKATCVFTDPPYGVSVGAKNRLLNTVQRAGRCLTDIEDDDASPEELKARLVPAFVNYREIVMAEDCTLFVCGPQGGGLGMMMMMMIEAGLPSRHVIIWKKNQPTFSMGRLDYDYQHEPILLTWGKRHKKIMNGDYTKSVWEVDKPRASADHPTMKPVELYTNAYLNHTEAGDTVADLYGGSGTAFIAAHRAGRRAFCMEIEPRYADVILKRCEAEGLTVTLADEPKKAKAKK